MNTNRWPNCGAGARAGGSGAVPRWRSSARPHDECSESPVQRRRAEWQLQKAAMEAVQQSQLLAFAGTRQPSRSGSCSALYLAEGVGSS